MHEIGYWSSPSCVLDIGPAVSRLTYVSVLFTILIGSHGCCRKRGLPSLLSKVVAEQANTSDICPSVNNPKRNSSWISPWTDTVSRTEIWARIVGTICVVGPYDG
jgi:hypothetical protein